MISLEDNLQSSESHTEAHRERRGIDHQRLRAHKALEARAKTLADRRSFALNTKQYDAFVAALDMAPKSRPRLERLFAKPSVLVSSI